MSFLKIFQKGLDQLQGKLIRQSLQRTIESLETADSLRTISNLKKLKGHKSAYRIRIGDYRLGFFYENSIISLARFVNRKDIYTLFP